MPHVSRPVVAVTMGDPAGIGPEVIVRAWQEARRNAPGQLMVVGHSEVMRRAVRLVQADIEVKAVDSVQAMPREDASGNTLYCLDVCRDEANDVPAGRVDPRGGAAAYQAITAATRMALAGDAAAIVTGPLSKAALHAAGHFYPGHTELLAELCGVREFGMMLYLNRDQGAGGKERLPPLERAGTGPSAHLGIVHVTLHQSLRSVFDALTIPAIVSKCRLIESVLRRLGVSHPRLAVCALNPHGGEEGLFGREEETVIVPAVSAARDAGLEVHGPIPADTLMVRAAGGEFDGVVAMYHDQGHIAMKLMGMHEAVNITLGLPIIRTSVAHGTAFDRAWQGTARADGMVAAVRTAARLAANR